MSKRISLLLAVLLLSIGLVTRVYAQDPIEHTWQNASKAGKVQIYKAKDGKFYGKIVWLKEPNKDGKPRLDSHNPDEKLRTRPVQGLVILKGFKKDGNEYVDGTIYDPKGGKTYSCKMTLDGSKLEIRGYVGISLIGRSETWTKAD
jgi:uncharacterized protein (DUF2147 family)